MNPLFTIGHSTHSMDAFLGLLSRHRIEAIADVRSQPYSRHTPCFSRQALEGTLKAARIHYVFLGRELGARPDGRECYIGNTVSFDHIASEVSFIKGLARLREGLLSYRIALLCAEKEPLDCHRTILIARHMAQFATITHILSGGELESHEETENRLLERYEWKEDELFRSREDRLAEAYTRRGSEIAWAESEMRSTL